MLDKGLHQLNQILALQPRFGPGGRGLALRGGEQPPSRGGGGTPAEITVKAGQEGAQLRAQLLFHSLFISKVNGGIFKVAHCLRDQYVETVLH